MTVQEKQYGPIRIADDQMSMTAEEIEQDRELYGYLREWLFDGTQLALTYTARFVPFSNSRNKGSDHKSLNWYIVFSAGQESMGFDYSIGLGLTRHPALDKLIHRMPKGITVNEGTALTMVLEEGKAPYLKDFNDIESRLHYTAPIPKPSLMGVIHSLVVDADVVDFLTFEDWASEMGYDTDSRSAEKTYEVCRKQTADFMRVFKLGYKEIGELRDLFIDY